MSLRLTDTGLLAIVVMFATLTLIYLRSRIALENNWPILYYVALVFYQKANEYVVNASAVYVGVVAAMFLRFEFMGARMVKFVRGIELVILLYVVFRCLNYVLL